MSGKDQIIESIIKDAKDFASQIIKEADEKSASIKDVAQTKAAAEEMQAIEIAEAEVKENLKRQASVTSLDVRKFSLSLKQELVGKCFNDALKSLVGLSNEKNALLIKGLLKNAEDGERVTIAAKDKAFINQKFLNEAAPGKKLTLNEKNGNFSGGIVLSEKSYEKNLSFEVLLEEIKQEIEPQVSQKLFEG